MKQEKDTQISILVDLFCQRQINYEELIYELKKLTWSAFAMGLVIGITLTIFVNAIR